MYISQQNSIYIRAEVGLLRAEKERKQGIYIGVMLALSVTKNNNK